ncbi:MAG: hypothetical protein ACOYYS_17835 [Chloroflexota bacterium]
MSETERYSQLEKQNIARTMKQRLALLITVLATATLLMVFKVGDTMWPMWLADHRQQITGFLLLSLIFVIFLTPILIEANINPRPLSGPGKRPMDMGDNAGWRDG